jgi:hypothetical protein
MLSRACPALNETAAIIASEPQNHLVPIRITGGIKTPRACKPLAVASN